MRSIDRWLDDPFTPNAFWHAIDRSVDLDGFRWCTRQEVDAFDIVGLWYSQSNHDRHLERVVPGLRVRDVVLIPGVNRVVVDVEGLAQPPTREVDPDTLVLRDLVEWLTAILMFEGDVRDA